MKYTVLSMASFLELVSQKKTKTSTPELVISCSGRTVCYKKPSPEIEPRKRQVPAPERVADRNVCIKEPSPDMGP